VIDPLLEQTIDVARRAGEAIMGIYESGDLEVKTKDDDRHSPVTKADKLANKIIEDGLLQISEYPVVSEEGSHDAENSDTFWVVDPLDGTKEFIKREGEFTVNIGLVRNTEPIMGVVYAPLEKVLYFGVVGRGAWRQPDGEAATPIFAEFHEKIPVVATRKSLGGQMEQFLEKLGEHRLIYPGPTIRFCVVAEGSAAVYPRFAPCFLWDTAAPHAILRAAGGTVKDLDGRELTYMPARTLESPFFVAAAKGEKYPMLVNKVVR
jgi:3'(2'), 5'-bisphosphate nucleotidase